MKKGITLFIILFYLVNPCYAQSANEFTPLETTINQRGKMKSLTGFIQIAGSKYFNIYSQEASGLLKLIRRLDIRSEYLLLEGASSGRKQLQDMLGAIVDAIFLEASDVLRMYLYSFKGNIKICQNQRELNKAFREVFGRGSKDTAFYAHDTNSIYINMRNICPENLAYEIAHTIISHYFVVLPPVEVREILAKDVGQQIKKLAK